MHCDLIPLTDILHSGCSGDSSRNDISGDVCHPSAQCLMPQQPNKTLNPSRATSAAGYVTPLPLTCCMARVQVTALGTVIVGTSATLFAHHLAAEQDVAASVHPPLMYCLLLALLLLPADFAYKACPTRISLL